MKKFRSRKGLTLVELVVTVAILGIVSGFSITIVVTAMNNYSEAAIVQKEQDTALMIEDYIVRHARVATKVAFVGNDDLKTDSRYPESIAPDKSKTNLQGYFIAKVGTDVETFDYAIEDAATGEYKFGTSDPQKYTTLVYKDVSEITVSFERQKTVASDSQKKCSYYMNYYIKMKTGYVIRGQVVMNNADTKEMDNLAGGTSKGLTSALVDKLNEYTIIKVVDNYTTYSVSPTGNCAIMFR